MKILILGANGMIGHQLWKYLSFESSNQIYGTVRKDWQFYSQFGIYTKNNLFSNMDAVNFHSFEKLFNDLNPQVILNCIGITLRKTDLKDSLKTIEVNGVFPHKIQNWCHKNNSKLIHFSTDCVFDGQSGYYNEESLPSAKDIYGKTKFLGEVTYGNALTLRTPVIGPELEGKTELLEWFLGQKNTKVKGFSKVIYSGTTTLNLSKEIYNIIQNHPSLCGLYHISGPEISKFDLLTMINKYIDNKVDIEDFSEIVSNKSLDCSKYSLATNYIPPSWEDMIF
ncbi:MAG: SDR family oxidoreductase, partial [Bdellovibrionales bacterium]|nr:SDR family oxidoreductase [Bdellovibrionales bacterium]